MRVRGEIECVRESGINMTRVFVCERVCVCERERKIHAIKMTHIN